VLQYRFDGADTWTTDSGNFQTTTSITVSEVSGTFAQGNHTFEARTVWKSGSWFNYTSVFDLSGDDVVASRTSATYTWNVVAGLHVTLGNPAGIDHDCSGNQNPFFGGNVPCAGHVYGVDSITLAFHAPNETLGQFFHVEHVGVSESVPVYHATCAHGVAGSPDNVCATVVLKDLADGFHSLKIIAVDTATNVALSTAPTWANWTVDTQPPAVNIDTASHPVKCDDGQFDSGKCKTHLSTATFGAISNEESIFLYAIDPPGGTPPPRDSDLWQLAPNQIDPRPGHEGSHQGPRCHSTYAECYGATKNIQGIHIEVTPGEHTIVVEAIDEAGQTSDAT
jgi:hypothetical protein